MKGIMMPNDDLKFPHDVLEGPIEKDCNDVHGTSSRG